MTMQCPVCQHVNAADARFCSQCGTRLELVCGVCATPYSEGDRFCSQCGSPVGADAPPTPVAPATASVDEGADLARYVPEELLRKIRAARAGRTMSGERRTVTMLFADLQGSTAAAEHLDPEEWAEIANGAFAHLIAPVYRYEGTLARLQGDAILAFFGAPIAHEDDPVRAVRAGLDMVADLATYRQEVLERTGIPIDVRVGINTGLVVVGEVGSDLRVEYTALGDAINVAARMEQTAEPGTVRVTDETLRLLGGAFEAETRGAIEVKGRSDAVLAHRVVRPVADHRDEPVAGTPLVGREGELERLTGLVGRLQDGIGGICTLAGEAGVGKSRLLAALRATLEQDRVLALTAGRDGHLAWLRGVARSYDRQIPHATFMDLMCGWWDTTNGGDCFSVILDAVEHALGHPDPDLAGLLATLTGSPLPDDQRLLVEALPAPVLHERTTEAVSTYLRAEARRRPVLVVLDDLHWADAMTLALVEQLMDVTETAALGLLLVMRPMRDDPSWHLVEVAARDHAHRHASLELQPLTDEATDALLQTLLDGMTVDDDLRTAIIDRAKGNPLFVEEIVRSVGEGSASHGATGLGRAQVEVPPSLTGLLTSRLDRLDDVLRHVAQVASVIGREFDLPTLAAVTDQLTDLEGHVVDLVRRGILEERRRLPEPIWTFRHPLIRETAYSTVLLRTRRELHGRIAAHLGERDPDAVHEIARHWLEAGEPMRAFPWLVRAGEHSTRSMALREAIDYFSTALESPPDDADPELVVAAHTGLGDAYTLIPDLPNASASYQSLIDIGRESGRPTMQVVALNRLGFSTAALAGDVDAARGYLIQARDLAEEIGDEEGLVEYHMNSCMVSGMQGDYEQAAYHDEETERIGGQLGNDHLRVLGLMRKAGNLGALLRWDEARVALEEAIEVATESGDDGAVAYLHSQVAVQDARLGGDLPSAIALVRAGAPVVDRYTSTYAASLHQELASLALLAGEVELALAEFASARRIGMINTMTYGVAVGDSGRALALAISGSIEGHEDRRRTSLEALGTVQGGFFATSVWADLAQAEFVLGNLEQAESDLDQARRASGLTRMIETPRVGLTAVRIALQRSDLDEARAQLDEVATFVATHGMRIHESEQFVLDGALTVAEGRDEEAAVLLTEAVTTATESGRRPIRVEALCRLAAVRARAGEAAEAASLRERAEATVREMADLVVDAALRDSFLRAMAESTAMLTAAG